MSDLWLNIIGLSLVTLVFLVGYAALLAQLKTGFYLFRGGADPSISRFEYLWYTFRYLLGLIFVGAIYFGLLYNKFVVDIDWMSH